MRCITMLTYSAQCQFEGHLLYLRFFPKILFSKASFYTFDSFTANLLQVFHVTVHIKVTLWYFEFKEK